MRTRCFSRSWWEAAFSERLCTSCCVRRWLVCAANLLSVASGQPRAVAAAALLFVALVMGVDVAGGFARGATGLRLLVVDGASSCALREAARARVRRATQRLTRHGRRVASCRRPRAGSVSPHMNRRSTLMAESELGASERTDTESVRESIRNIQTIRRWWRRAGRARNRLLGGRTPGLTCSQCAAGSGPVRCSMWARTSDVWSSGLPMS